ncbi:MAG: NRDE family protein, partial [Methylocystaceae bacterium]
IEKGIHGLSNNLLDVPWPKVTRGIHMISNCLQHEDIEVEQLFTIMGDRELPSDQDLPQTGVGIEMERMLGPMFVTSPGYGTKSTTVLLIDCDQRVRFWERSYKPGQLEPWNQVYQEFEIHPLPWFRK